MATYFRMPGVSADSDEAVLESWSVEQGARVASGQTIASVETEKATVDVESDVDAIVHTLLVEDGATVPVGDPIAILLGVDEPASAAEKLLADLGVGGAPAGAAPSRRWSTGPPLTQWRRSWTPRCSRRRRRRPGRKARLPRPPRPSTSTPEPGPAPTSNGGRQFTSPSARRLARELGVDITTLSGSGPKGRVVNADVQAAAEAAPAQPRRPRLRRRPPPAGRRDGSRAGSGRRSAGAAVPEGWTAVPHSRVRKIIAQRLQESKTTAPHFYLRMSARVDALLALRAQLNAVGPGQGLGQRLDRQGRGPGAGGRAGDERGVDRGRGAPGPHRRRRGRGGEREGPGHPGDPGRRRAVDLRAVGEDQGCGGPRERRASCRRPTCRAAR